MLKLHQALTEALDGAVPEPPLSERRWLWRGAEQLGPLQHRLQAYLEELTEGGQWASGDAAEALRDFLFCEASFSE